MIKKFITEAYFIDLLKQTKKGKMTFSKTWQKPIRCQNGRKMNRRVNVNFVIILCISIQLKLRGQTFAV